MVFFRGMCRSLVHPGSGLSTKSLLERDVLHIAFVAMPEKGCFAMRKRRLVKGFDSVQTVLFFSCTGGGGACLVGDLGAGALGECASSVANKKTLACRLSLPAVTVCASHVCATYENKPTDHASKTWNIPGVLNIPGVWGGLFPSNTPHHIRGSNT